MWKRTVPALTGRGHAIHPTCVRVLYQAEDHTRLLVDVKAQSVLFLRHVDDEVGVSVHWEPSTITLDWASGKWSQWGQEFN